MEEDFPLYEDNNNGYLNGNQRPTFLIVLCFFSAVNILLFGILPSVSSPFSNIEDQQEQFDQSVTKVKNLYIKLGVDESILERVLQDLMIILKLKSIT